MRRAILVAGIGLMLGSAAAAQADDPLQPARSGQTQCYAPDPARKTCQAMAGYTFMGGQIQNQAEVLVSKNPAIVMKTVSTVTLVNGAICGPLRGEDIDAAQFTLNGARMTRDQSTQLATQLKTAFGARLGKVVCTTYVPNGSAFSAQVTLDGQSQPQDTQVVIWVSPRDGYNVAP